MPLQHVNANTLVRQTRIHLVKLCAKIPQIMCSASEDHAPGLCQLRTNYAYHFFGFVLHISVVKNQNLPN